MKKVVNGPKQAVAPGFVAGVFLGMLFAAGCQNHPTDEQIQQKAAQTTQQVKQGAEQAASTARVAAANAEDKLNAVAAGVKQGLQGGSSAPVVDLNKATRDQLVTLPGITPAKAHKIIAGRPYSTPNDLVSRDILTQDQFDRISGRVTAQTPAP
jgi:DNA uptake protein ComE-like DNA-binding protein